MTESQHGTAPPPDPPVGSPRKNRIADLGPVWITAIATLIAALAAAGVFAVHTSGSADTDGARHPAPASPGDTRTGSAVQTSTSAVAVAAAGTELWMKTINISFYHGLNIGPVPSTPVEQDSVPLPDLTVGTFDIDDNTGQLVRTDASRPTYNDCVTSTIVANDLNSDDNAFCWIGDGFVALIYSVMHYADKYYAWNITVWQGQPS